MVRASTHHSASSELPEKLSGRPPLIWAGQWAWSDIKMLNLESGNGGDGEWDLAAAGSRAQQGQWGCMVEIVGNRWEMG